MLAALLGHLHKEESAEDTALANISLLPLYLPLLPLQENTNQHLTKPWRKAFELLGRAQQLTLSLSLGIHCEQLPQSSLCLAASLQPSSAPAYSPMPCCPPK